MLGRPIVLVLLLVAVAGCAAPAVLPASPVAPAPTGAGEPSGNLWLLDGPRPAVDVTASRGAEPSILVDRFGPWIWIGDTAGLHRSNNGGATWTTSGNPFPPGMFGDGWSLAQDDDGVLYASTTQGELSVVARSSDNGATWDITPSRYLVEAAPISDRPWIAARGSGEVVLVTNADATETCAYSTDGATTFLNRAVLGGSPNPGNVVFDAQGRVMYANDGTIFRFSPKCSIGHSAINLPAHGPQIFVQLAVDDTDHQYVAVPTADNAGMAIIGYSHFVGAPKVLVVSPPELKENTFGTISVHNGEIAVAWYGSETPGAFTTPGFAGSWNVYTARVKDFWSATPTVSYVRLTTGPNHVGDFCFSGIGCTTGSGDRSLLDYFGIAHDATGNLHVAYGDDQSAGRVEVRYAKLAAIP
jgi:hypothetical protein